jgi:hypothetical protein
MNSVLKNNKLALTIRGKWEIQKKIRKNQTKNQRNPNKKTIN